MQDRKRITFLLVSIFKCHLLGSNSIYAHRLQTLRLRLKLFILVEFINVLKYNESSSLLNVVEGKTE
jgi:hypothetical protein